MGGTATLHGGAGEPLGEGSGKEPAKGGGTEPCRYVREEPTHLEVPGSSEKRKTRVAPAWVLEKRNEMEPET